MAPMTAVLDGASNAGVAGQPLRFRPTLLELATLQRPASERSFVNPAAVRSLQRIRIDWELAGCSRIR